MSINPMRRVVRVVKRCPNCERDLNTSMFGLNRSRRDGLAVLCRSCMREAKKFHAHGREYGTPEPRVVRSVDVARAASLDDCLAAQVAAIRQIERQLGLPESRLP